MIDRIVSAYGNLAEKNFLIEHGNEIYAAPLIKFLISKLSPQAKSYLEIGPGGGGMAKETLTAFPQIKQATAIEIIPKFATRTERIISNTLSKRSGSSWKVINDDFYHYINFKKESGNLQKFDVITSLYTGSYFPKDYCYQILDLAAPGGIVFIVDGIKASNKIEHTSDQNILANLKTLTHAYASFSLIPPIFNLLRSRDLYKLTHSPEFLSLHDIHENKRTKKEWQELEKGLSSDYPGAKGIDVLASTRLLWIPVPIYGKT